MRISEEDGQVGCNCLDDAHSLDMRTVHCTAQSQKADKRKAFTEALRNTGDDCNDIQPACTVKASRCMESEACICGCFCPPPPPRMRMRSRAEGPKRQEQAEGWHSGGRERVLAEQT